MDPARQGDAPVAARRRSTNHGRGILMAKVLAVVSQKGGVGKTTTAVNIAAGLGQRGVKTLLIDADPQGSVRFGLGLHAPEDRVGLSDFLAGTHSMQDIVRPTMLPWLRVVAAGGVSDAGGPPVPHRQRPKPHGLPQASAP